MGIESTVKIKELYNKRKRTFTILSRKKANVELTVDTWRHEAG